MESSRIFATEKISRILLKLAPPVMLAQLIQALYNIVVSEPHYTTFSKYVSNSSGDISSPFLNHHFTASIKVLQ